MSTSTKKVVFTRPYEHLIIGTCALEIATGKYFYFTPVMDGFSRAILNFSVGLSYHDDVFIATLNQTLTVLKSPVILHLTHKDAAKSYKLHDYIAKSHIYKAPEPNTPRLMHMTTFFAMLKKEFYNDHYEEINSQQELADELKEWVYYYNYERPQSATGGYPPINVLKGLISPN